MLFSIVGLIQPVLVLQLSIPSDKPFGFEIVLTDQQARKRRLIFSTSFREVEATELHAKVRIAAFCFCTREITHSGPKRKRRPPDRTAQHSAE